MGSGARGFIGEHGLPALVTLPEGPAPRSEPTEAPRDHRGYVLAGILFTIFLAGIDGTAVGPIMPMAIEDLGGSDLYAWAFAAYMLTTAMSMPVWGPGSDRWGRRRTFLAGVAVFVVGSLLCGLAPNMPLFIAARALQGIGAGAIFSLPFIVLAVVYPPERRARALGVVASAWAISSVAGPIVGTAIVTHMSWRWVFLVNLPVGLLASYLVLRGMRESVGDRRGRFDVLGSVLVGAAGATLITAFVNLGEGHTSWREAALIVGSAALFAAFLWHENRAPSPILPLNLFQARGYSVATAASILSAFVAFGLMAYLPLETEAIFHDPLPVGIVVGTFTIGWSGASLSAGRVIHRTGERIFALSGMVALAAGLSSLGPAFGTERVGMIAAAAALTGLGMGLMTPALTVSAQNSVETRRMGSAMASLQFLRQVAAAIGVGTIGLATRLGGFQTALYVLLVAAALGFALATLLPRTSLRAGVAAQGGGH